MVNEISSQVVEAALLPVEEAYKGKKRLGFRVYEQSPFMDTMHIETKDKSLTIARGTKLTPQEKDDESEFDEFRANIIQIKKVDTEQFIKLYTSNIKTMLELGSAGNKVFFVILCEVQEKAIGQDLVCLSWHRIEKRIQKMPNVVDFSYQTFLRGIKELVKKKILAVAEEDEHFYINPTLLFNGDRVRFVTEYRKDKSITPKQIQEQQQEKELQQEQEQQQLFQGEE
jgi:hypothetical protein